MGFMLALLPPQNGQRDIIEGDAERIPILRVRIH